MKRGGLEAYQKAGGRRRRDELVRKHAPLVKKVAWRLIHRLPSSVEIDDLISVGSIGLLQAIEAFDPSKGTRFESFAEFRIKGAMLDELRSYDFMSRTSRGRSNKIAEAEERLTQELGRDPTLEELAEDTELNVDQVEKLKAESEQTAFLTLDDLGTLATETTEAADELMTGGQPEDPFGHTLFHELRARLTEALGDLKERDQLMMSLYYAEDLNFKEVGEVLDVTESRISQIHSEVIKKLRKKMRKHTG